MNSNICNKKHHVKAHEFFLKPFITESSKPCHSFVYQVSIGNHKSDLIKFCQQFYYLAQMRLLNTFKSWDHACAARQAVFFMNHHINFVLKAGQSRTGMVKSLKTTPLVSDS